MKLVIAIVNKDDSAILREELVKNKFGVTKLSTKGGFLHADNMTMLIGVEDERLEEAMELIKENCKKRKALVPGSISDFFPTGGHIGVPLEITVGGATCFVVNVEQFIRI